MRAAKRMAARVGYDPDTGLHLAETPQVEEEPMILEDGKTTLFTLVEVSLLYKSHFRVKNWYKIILSLFYIPSKSEQ